MFIRHYSSFCECIWHDFYEVMSPRSDSSSTVVLQESRGHSVCRWRLGCLCGSRLYRWSCKVLYFYKYFHTGMSESFSKMLLWLCSFQCTKRTSWVSVRCPGERARLHLSRPARAASPSSSWCLFGWEGRPSTPPTSTVSRSLTPLNRVKRFPKKLTSFRLPTDTSNYFLLQNVLQLDCCIGIIGGKPKHSLYFIGFQGERKLEIKLGFLSLMK